MQNTSIRLNLNIYVIAHLMVTTMNRLKDMNCIKEPLEDWNMNSLESAWINGIMNITIMKEKLLDNGKYPC